MQDTVTFIIKEFLRSFHSSVKKNNSILDLGSGYFRHTRFLKMIGFSEITCIDIQKFSKQPSDITMIYHDLENGIPLEDQVIDILLATYLFMFIKNKEQLVKEIFRVSKPNGFVICSVLNKRDKQGNDLMVTGKSVKNEDLAELFKEVGFSIKYLNKNKGFIARREQQQ